MKILYCYVAFTDRNGNTRPLRGLKEIELNFSTTDIYRYNNLTNALISSPRETPLPNEFWANRTPQTNIYNINVIAGANGSGKSTVIQYLMDMLNYIYHGFGESLKDQARHMRHDPSENHNILLFDSNDEMYILDLRKGYISSSLCFEGFHKSPRLLSKQGAEALLQNMKVINLSNTLTQRDYALHVGSLNERLRNDFVYDCTLGATIGPDVGQFFPYEVYKQVKYLFDPRQIIERKNLDKAIPEIRLPRALHLSPLWARFEKAFNNLTTRDNSRTSYDSLFQSSLHVQLAILCAISFVENMISLTGAKVYTYPYPLKLFEKKKQIHKALCKKTLISFIDQAEKWIKDVLFSLIVSGSSDDTLQVWNYSTSKHLITMNGEDKKRFKYVIVLPDRRIVSGTDAATLCVWDAVTGQCLQVLDGHTSYIRCVSQLSEERLVSGSEDTTLRVWNASTGECLHILRGHEAPINCMAVLPNGRIVSGAEDTNLRVWDANTGECLHTMEGHKEWVRCMAVLSGHSVVSGSWDNTLRVWNTATGKCLQTLEGHEDCVTCVAVVPNKYIISGSADTTLRLWEPTTGRCIKTLKGHTRRVTCVVALPNGNVVSGSVDATLRVWDVETGDCLYMLQGHTLAITCLEMLPDGCVVSGSSDGTLRIWDTSLGQCLQTLTGHEWGINCIALLPGNQMENDKTASLINERAKQCREYIQYVLDDPDGLISRFQHTNIEINEFELLLPQEHCNEGEQIEKSLVTFLKRYHNTCTPYYTLDFNWGLSSGEENLLRLFSWLFHIFPRTGENGEYRYQIRNNPEHTYDGGNCCDSVLLFFDEADLTFHPEWQRRLIHILTAFLPTIYPPDCVKDLQLVLTTHSPLLLGDIPRENIRFLHRADEGELTQRENSSETFGQNIHTILKESFFLEHGTVGQFAANKIDALAQRLVQLKEDGIVPDVSASELDTIRQTVALVAPGVLRAKLEQLLREVESRMEMPDVDTLVTQTRRLSREQRQRFLRQLQEDAEP